MAQATAPVRVPASYVPLKRVDYGAELAMFLDCPARFGALTLPPPTIGVYSLLELIDSAYFKDPGSCSTADLALALYLVARREEALEAACAWQRGQKSPLEQAAYRWFLPYARGVRSELAELVRFTHEIPFLGLEMLPPGGTPEREWIFDADFVGGFTAVVAMTAGVSPFEILWRMPLTRSGHLYAARARFEGVREVGRRDDPAAIRLLLAEAEAREEAGELHPWQIREPEWYPPTPRQVAKNIHIIAQHRELLRQRKRHHGDQR